MQKWAQMAKYRYRALLGVLRCGHGGSFIVGNTTQPETCPSVGWCFFFARLWPCLLLFAATHSLFLCSSGFSPCMSLPPVAPHRLSHHDPVAAKSTPRRRITHNSGEAQPCSTRKQTSPSSISMCRGDAFHSLPLVPASPVAR